MNKLVRTISVISVVSLLSACGESGSGVPAAAPSAILDGTVTDAVITNGTLRVYKFDDGKQGDLIAETVTDGNGDFVIDDFTSQDRPVVIEVTGGRYTEEASGVSVDLIQGQMLRAYMFYEQGSQITLQVTPFTHLASCLADSKIRAGVNVNNAITEATSAFSGLVGVDILGTKPLDITDPNNASFEVTDSLRYGAVLAAISSYTAEVSDLNGVTPHRFNQNTSIYATQVLCQDISADGVFNGLGFINNGASIGQLSLGSVVIDVDTLRTKIAQHILSIMSSDRNATSLDVNVFVLYANEIASSTDAVFGGVPATPVDNVGPTVTAVLAPDSFLKDIVNLSFIVADPIGLNSVTFEVNGAPHSNGQIDLPVMSLNSTNYTDGVITITVVATDILNNISNVDFNYVVDNTSPTIELTSALLVNNKNYTATGSYLKEGAPVTSIQVNGVDASIDTDLQTWTADIVLLSGENIVILDITDSAANTNSVDIQVDVDLIFPAISPNLTQVIYTTFEGQLNLCTAGTLSPTSSVSNPVCLSTDNVSLSGAALTGDIQNFGYTLLGFSPTDPSGAGVFTPQDEITVEYKYELNDVEVIGYTTAPKTTAVASRNLFYYFPMVTEYLGVDWYQTTTTDVHKVTFRVTDNAGNFKTLTYELQFDVLIPEIAITTTIEDSLFASSTFANRTGIDGVGIKVNYTFKNSSPNSLLVSFDDAEAHSVKHTYETGIRQNIARLKTTKKNRYKFYTGLGISGTSFLAPVSGWQEPPVVYKGNGASMPTSKMTYGSYTSFNSDTLSPPVSTAWIAPFREEMCSFNPRKVVVYGDNVYTNFHKTVTVSSNTTDYHINVSVTAAWPYTAGKSCIESANLAVSPKPRANNWEKRTTYSYQNKSGYPRNNITPVVTDFNVDTESLVVINETLGQVILPINGWYAIPKQTAISVVKTARMPVLTHFYDSELSNLDTLGYSLKKQDKMTVWKIDTDLAMKRVIDPGNIDDVNDVTPSISIAGLGVYQKTISR